MKAALYRSFRGPISVETVPDPTPAPDGVVLEVKANGICRSDWHGWVGHDADIELPHVPGHEIAGIVQEVGAEVTRWVPGDRVSVPFIAGCGRCGPCRRGDDQVCDDQFQPGFHGWGGFAERVALRRADRTLVRLPDALDFVTAASLGCRFATSFRAVVHQGRVQPGTWVAVHGCGGVGLAAIAIAHGLGARVIAVDIRDEPLALASQQGAEHAIRGGHVESVVEQIRELTGGGAHVSLDALGHPDCAFASVACLAKRGRHVQVGLLAGDAAATALPMDRVVAHELEIVGSHGMPAHAYDAMLGMVESGAVDPSSLVTRQVSLAEGAALLAGMDDYALSGMAVIDRF